MTKRNRERENGSRKGTEFVSVGWVCWSNISSAYLFPPVPYLTLSADSTVSQERGNTMKKIICRTTKGDAAYFGNLFDVDKLLCQVPISSGIST